MEEGRTLNLGHESITSLNRVNRFRIPTEATEADIEKTECLYNRLVGLESDDREKLRIPISRWIKSKTPEEAIDKIIDLGIAFEALYLSDIDEMTELSFRLRFHAAWHLRENEKDRKALMKEFQEIYAWRSSVVHTGKLPKKKISKKRKRPYTGDEVAAFVRRTQDLCRESILKIIEDGGFPDWDSLILGVETEGVGN